MLRSVAVLFLYVDKVVCGNEILVREKIFVKSLKYYVVKVKLKMAVKKSVVYDGSDYAGKKNVGRLYRFLYLG